MATAMIKDIDRASKRRELVTNKNSRLNWSGDSRKNAKEARNLIKVVISMTKTLHASLKQVKPFT
jgi:hypothetical protein